MKQIGIRDHFWVTFLLALGAVLLLTGCQPIAAKIDPPAHSSQPVAPQPASKPSAFSVLQLTGEDSEATETVTVFTVQMDIRGNFDKDTYDRLAATYASDVKVESLLVCEQQRKVWTLYIANTPANLSVVQQIQEHVVIPKENTSLFEIRSGRRFSIDRTVPLTTVLGTGVPGDLTTTVPLLAKHYAQMIGLPSPGADRVMPKTSATALLLLSTGINDQPNARSEYILVPFVNVDTACNEEVPDDIFDCVKWCSNCIECGWYCFLCSSSVNE